MNALVEKIRETTDATDAEIAEALVTLLHEKLCSPLTKEQPTAQEIIQKLAAGDSKYFLEHHVNFVREVIALPNPTRVPTVFIRNLIFNTTGENWTARKISSRLNRYNDLIGNSSAQWDGEKYSAAWEIEWNPPLL